MIIDYKVIDRILDLVNKTRKDTGNPNFKPRKIYLGSEEYKALGSPKELFTIPVVKANQLTYIALER